MSLRVQMMSPQPFAFNNQEIGCVFPPASKSRVVPVTTPKGPGEIDAVYAPATYTFLLVDRQLGGEIQIDHSDHFYISQFWIGPVDPDEPVQAEIHGELLTPEFFKRLLAAALEVGGTKALWYPPKTQIERPDGSRVISGPQGFIEAIPTPPSGGRGKSRKIDPATSEPYERVWNDPDEIAETVRLMEVAEAAFNSPHYPADKLDLSTVAKREAWVAESSGVWSPGTVHVQLALARKSGLFKSRRKKRE